jgi:uncharacterized protein
MSERIRRVARERRARSEVPLTSGSIRGECVARYWSAPVGTVGVRLERGAVVTLSTEGSSSASSPPGGGTGPVDEPARSGAATPVSRPAGEMLGLARPECLRLLAEASFGRIAVNGSSGPVIRPVNYVFDEPSQSVIFRTALGSKFHALLRSARAAFEIDGTDPSGRCGWSVIIAGVIEEVTNQSELRRLETIGLDPWAPGFKGHWVRIRANTVSGRRIAISADATPGYRA